MIKIGICDDTIAILEQLESYLYDFYEEREIKLYKYISGEALLASMEHFDILFLDVELENINGIETAREIRKTDIDVFIVIISAHEDYKKYGYSLHLFDYLDKPIKQERFLKLIQEYETYKNREKPKEYITIKGIYETLRFNIEDIYYFEYINRKIKAITSQGEFMFYGKLVDIEERLKTDGFVMSHRAYVINLRYVVSMSNQEILLSQHHVVPISRKKVKKVREAYTQYLGNKIER